MAPESEPSATSALSDNNFKVFEVDQSEGGEKRLLNACTRDGSVDWYGKPAVKGSTGGWRCGMLLLVNQGLVSLAFAGVEVNMVLFAKSVLRQTNAEAANTFSRWMGTFYFCSLIGALLSDSYLGRYLTCVTFQIVHIIGLIALSLSTNLFLLRPPGCGEIGQLCEPHRPMEVAMFYISIYLIALGNGAPEPALAAFGADQFDEEDSEERQAKTSFYSYFYVALNLGCLVAETVLVYMESMGHWVPAFWICTGSSVVGSVLFLGGSFRYRHFKASGNPISRFSQVIVASMRKINHELPSNGGGLYETIGWEGETNGSRRILHTKGFKFLDRAAFITRDDISLMSNQGQTPNPWHLCTVTQVTKREPKPPSALRRIGIGLAIGIVGLIIAGFVERKRLKYASNSGEETSSLSIFWQTPQYVLVGVSEAFVYVSQMEFYSSQTPDGLKSLGIALWMTSSAMGSYVASMILTVVMEITTKNGQPGWVPPNLNDGHLDRFFFLSAGLTALNLALYILCAKRYKSISLEKRESIN
ncbi:hypothetical protein ACE6H2_007541 [Prunus campanulata]